jgi:hypothetical protein
MTPEWDQTLFLLVVEVEKLVVAVVDTDNLAVVVYTGASDIVAVVVPAYDRHGSHQGY